MATIQDRSFTHNYSGLKNQFGVAGALAILCLTGYEIMRRRRRGRGLKLKNGENEDVRSVETWEFGYLYQGRCWANNPSPPPPKWPLSWVKQAICFPEKNLPELIGIDATLYIRFLRACRWFVAIHTLTTFPIIFSIHVVFSPSDVSIASIDKASISTAVEDDRGKHLLWVHVIVLYWIAITWVLTLLWLARGMFRYRAQLLDSKAAELAQADPDRPVHHNRALRLRTVMVTNVPVNLRTETALKEYFEYYMSRPLGPPPIAPGFIPKLIAFLFNRASHSSAVKRFKSAADTEATEHLAGDQNKDVPAIVERVIIARKMTELASLLDRRVDIQKKLEYAHVKLARKALGVVEERLCYPGSERKGLLSRHVSNNNSRSQSQNGDVETNIEQQKLVTKTLAPFVTEFAVPSPKPVRHKVSRFLHFARAVAPFSRNYQDDTVSYPPSSPVSITSPSKYATIWEALHSLPRSSLDAFQPLIRLNRLFRGQTVPAIDYYAAKLGLLTALIDENRGRPLDNFQASSTAFVTFEKIEDARKAVKYLQVHPKNPLACIAVPAPDVSDLDWARVMKSSFTGEFLKDWVVDLGVWAFTISWIIPISILVGLVNIQNLSIFIPGLKSYFDKNPHDKEAISSLLPTILFSLLTILIPMILLLIAKKAHTIITFSKLHDTIMIRYWKFLVCNLLIFFCIGVAALESFVQSFKATVNFIPVIASSFPTAAPFYVGWLILQTAIHGFLELGLYGLPLILYPSTRASKTLRRRAAGIRPRTFNFYYWLPNHVLVTTIVVCFALLNPLIIPFALVYFCIESTIVKHQLIHVYSKQYENNGKLILVRIVRYSLDGLMLAHVIFLAFSIVLRQTGEAAGTGILLGLTAIVKLILTRMCRAKFIEADRAEDFIYSAPEHEAAVPNSTIESRPQELVHSDVEKNGSQPGGFHTLSGFLPYGSAKFWTWKMPRGVPFHYASYPPQHNHKRPPLQRHGNAARRGPIPFGQNSEHSFTRNQSRQPSENREPATNVIGDAEKSDHHDVGDIPHTPPAHGNGSADTALVTLHPPHPTWDDFPHLDRPYDNPIYVSPLDNFLWLPRNPFGKLDLDDSIDLHEVLTSEPGASKLGRWMNHTVLEDGAQMVETPGEMNSPELEASEGYVSPPSFRQSHQSSFQLEQQRYTGNEQITLSSVLSSRATRNEAEDDIEDSGHLSPFIMSRRRRVTSDPNNNRKRISIHGRQTSVFPTEPLHRPLTGSSQVSRFSSRPQSLSHLRDPVNLPDVQAQGEFVAALESQVEIPANAERSEEPLTAVPVRDAVVGEIIVEEREEALERIRKEENEQRSREAPKPSWWSGWLWHRSKPGTVDNPTDTPSK
ncbi:hypothetical protein M422DRAFT_200178 [Sphaerobolus stellatus SS14]|nr:hypothetical protein M422DRAFT_200178 [Sphaerobolus stellatus SS14]